METKKIIKLGVDFVWLLRKLGFESENSVDLDTDRRQLLQVIIVYTIAVVVEAIRKELSKWTLVSKGLIFLVDDGEEGSNVLDRDFSNGGKSDMNAFRYEEFCEPEHWIQVALQG
ncbi:hypothetical protein QYF36_014625 [Acer negundo]|nr:hypothetical protein QYF36_014625 [Acer negundo]